MTSKKGVVVLALLMIIKERVVDSLLAHSGGTETAGAALRRFQVFDFHALRRSDPLQDHLCDSVAFLHLKILVSKVGQNNADVPAVIVIHHAG